MTKIAVFISGNGGNFEAIAKAHKVSLVVSDKKDAYGLHRANKLGVDTYVPDKSQILQNTDTKPHLSKEQENLVLANADIAKFTNIEREMLILQKLKEYKIEWIFLAGYMKIVGPTLLEEYEGRIINIHPSLLPLYPGLHSIERAYEDIKNDKNLSQEKKMGITIHYVDSGMDTGKIILQDSFIVKDNDTLDTVEEKIHKLEHKNYPRVVAKLIKS